MSLPTPPNERLSLTEPSGALASCACGLAATQPVTSTPTSRRGRAGRGTIGSWTDLSRLMALRKNGSRQHGCFGRQPDSKPWAVTLKGLYCTVADSAASNIKHLGQSHHSPLTIVN